jgi:hypothetical protein
MTNQNTNRLKNIFFLITCLPVLFLACKKNYSNKPKDTSPPILTLKGNQNDTITLSTLYADMGAVAIDDQDGDLSKKITVSGAVNVNFKGDYIKEYSIKDAAGNTATQTRNIKVINSVEYLAGNYSAFCTTSDLSSISFG